MTSTSAADASAVPAAMPASREVGWLEQMVLIRAFESALDPLALAGKIPGGVHLAIGQEAVAVGSISALAPTDLVSGSHRSHHHALAKGLPPDRVMAELFGRTTGVSGGRGGSMHLAGWGHGYLGGNGIVGAGLGVAMGAALAARLQGRDQVAVGFFGEGAVNTGRTWETLNLAAVWHLPLIAVCENNLYAVETPTASVTAGSIVMRGLAFGLESLQVDGQDVGAMHRAVADARARALEDGRPTLIEALTYRYEGHSTAQVINYRTADEVADWRTHRDPIDRLRAELERRGDLPAGAYDAMVEDARAVVANAVAFAEASPHPGPEAATAGVTGLELNMRGKS